MFYKRKEKSKMENLKKFFTVLALVLAFSFSTANVFAEDLGIVDLDKVLNSYTKAQDVSADLKVKEAELQKFLADAQKRLKDAKTPLERKNLEDKLTAEFKIKSDSFRDAQIKEWKQIEDCVFAAISRASANKKISTVLNKAGVLQGGIDLTDDVIVILNTK